MANLKLNDILLVAEIKKKREARKFPGLQYDYNILGSILRSTIW